jgi:hypothetical protein
LTPGQAAYVLERLISDRRLSPGEVSRYVSEMGREISDLEQRLQRLREAHGGSAGGGGGAAAPARRGPGRPPGRPGRPPGRPGRPPGRPRGRRPGRPPAAASAASTPSKGGAKRGRRSAITPEQLASRQLQGRYLALVRQFPAGRRANFAKTAKEKGREAAIKEMQDSLKK